MEKILEYLEDLSLSDTEAKLYLELLKSGPIAVKDLAKNIGIKRTTAYFHIELLIEKGLIVKIVQDAHKKIAATKPEEGIQNLIEQRLEAAKNAKETFPTMLKEIQEKFPLGEGFEDSEVKYYKGKVGIQKIYEEALSTKELRSYFNNEVIQNELPENTSMFAEALAKNKTIKMFEIIQNTEKSKKIAKGFQSVNEDHKRYRYRMLPEGVKLSSTDILIYDGNVAIINIANQISGVILRNEEYYNTSKEIFDLLWKILTPKDQKEDE